MLKKTFQNIATKLKAIIELKKAHRGMFKENK
jgi:hypothetical protein